MNDSKGTADEPIAAVEPIQPRPATRPSDHPRVSQGQVVAVSVQPPGSAEAQFLQGLPPEHIHKAIESSTQIQLRNLDLQAKELDQGDAERERGHQRSMKLIDLKVENDRGLRRIAALVLLGVAVFVGFAIAHQKYDMAEKIVYALLGVVGGYIAGRANPKGRGEK